MRFGCDVAGRCVVPCVSERPAGQRELPSPTVTLPQPLRIAKRIKHMPVHSFDAKGRPRVNSASVQLRLPGTSAADYVRDLVPLICNCGVRTPSAEVLFCSEMPWDCPRRSAGPNEKPPTV